MWMFLVLLFALLPCSAMARVPHPTEVCPAVHASNRWSDDVDPWSARARTAGFVPQIRIGFEQRVDETQDARFREQLTRVDDTLRFNSAQTDTLDGRGDQWKFEISAVFDLERAVFSDDELKANETARRVLTYRLAACDQALTLFFEWRKHSRLARVAEQAQRPIHAEDRDLAQARLDTLTNGWFSRTLTQEQP